MKVRGFTLVELLVTVTVLAIIGMIAVPAFNNAILGNRLASISNSFVASVQLARSEAIKRNQLVKLCSSANGTSCGGGGWHQGWIIFNDPDGDNTIGAGETRVHYQQALPAEFSFSGDNATLSIRGTGLIDAGANLTLCRHSPAPGAQERTVAVSTTGRASVATTTTGTCPGP